MRLQRDFTDQAGPSGRKFQRVCGLWLLLGVLAATVFGQTFQGSLRGAVRDSGGQVVAGATLTLTNPATSIARTTVANDAGEYAFERIDPGRYVLTVTRDGFKKLERQNVTIETQQQLSLDLQLEVGNVTESVTVTDVVPLIETANASVGQIVNKQFLDNLPNFGRNPFALTTISPQVLLVGTVGETRQQDQTASSQISLAGGPVRGNNYLFDGVPIADIASRAVIIPSLEATREVKLQVNTYDAEAGRTGGGLFNLTARSGENQVHSSIFGFIQPQRLQANTFFANRSGIKRPNAPYKLYGGSFGGPVYIPKVYDGRNKTFFWFASEGYRATTFRTEIFTVPTALERQGDFSRNTRAC